MQTVMVLGATGLLGSSLCPYLARKGYRVLRAGRNAVCEVTVDATSAESLTKLLESERPSYVINLIGATDLDRCETDVCYAYQANTAVPAALAVASSLLSATELQMVHVSTDHVYNDQGPHSENQARPLNVYSLSKYAGELLSNPANTAILRTNFFGRSNIPYRSSFSDWVVGSLVAKKNVTLFQDVAFSPMSIDSLCKVISRVMEKKVTGTYNVGSRGGMSKADFALALARELGLQTDSVKLGRLADFSLKARRSNDMCMDVSKLESVLDFQCPRLVDEIKHTAKEYQIA